MASWCVGEVRGTKLHTPIMIIDKNMTEYQITSNWKLDPMASFDGWLRFLQFGPKTAYITATYTWSEIMTTPLFCND